MNENTLNKNFAVYPNPNSKGAFNIQNETSEKWEVYNVNGAKILSGNGKIIDVSNFSKGLYILNIKNSFRKLLFN